MDRTNPNDRESENFKPELPVLTTKDVTSASQTYAVSGGSITDNGGFEIFARGVCWAAHESPDLTDNKTVDGNGSGVFDSFITDLAPETMYYVRAYATNFSGTSYGNQVFFRTQPMPVTDIDGNTYSALFIGDQIWMKENLKTTKYNDGTDIPLINDDAEWQEAPFDGYCWYDNDMSAYKFTYGALYNWITVNSGKLCPAGWHVPSFSEWNVLITYLGGEDHAGGKMKEAGFNHWNEPNQDANNESGFTGLPGGWRSITGNFSALREVSFWWSSTQFDSMFSYYLELEYNIGKAFILYGRKGNGHFVRCIKN